MATAPNLRVRISADLADIKQGLAVLRGDLNKLKTSAARSGPDTSGWVSGLQAARRQLAGFIATYASIRTLGGLAKVSDEAAGIAGRLRLATKSQEEFNAAQDETFDIAQRTQAGWKDTVGLYSRIAQSSDQLGLSQKKQLELTEAVSMALAISGTTGEAAAGVMRQFGQALAGGRVQAEEFGSIIDDGGRIVQSLAKHLGITAGEVREYVNKGKVSSKDLADSQIKDLKVLEAEYAKLPKSIGGGFTQIRNSFVRFMNDQNEATGSSQAFVSVLRDIADDLPKFFEPILDVMVQLAKAMKGVEKNGETLGEKTSGLADIGQFLASVFRVLAIGAIAVKNSVEILTTFIAALATGAFKAAEALVKYLAGAFTTLGNTWDALKSGGPVEAFKAWSASAKGVMDDLAGHRRSMVAGFQAASDMIKNDASELSRGWAAMVSQIDKTVGKIKKKSEPSTEGSDGAGTGTGTSTGNGAGKVAAESNALLRDSVTRALAELDRLYAENEIGIREYFATRTELQQQSIDLEIAQARMSLAATKDAGQRQKLEEQIIKLQRDRADVATKGAEAQKKAEDELAKSLDAVHLRLMELDGKTGAVERVKLETEYQELFNKLDKNSDAAGRKMVENLIDRLVAKAQGDELKQAGENIANALQGKETSISAQVSGGMLGYGEGERQIADARAKAIADLQMLRTQAVASLANMTEGTPEHAAVLNGITAIDTQIAQVNATQQKFRQGVEDLAVSAFGDFLGDLTTGAKNFKTAFADMVKSFVAGVAKMIAQELALRAIKSAMSAWGGGGGSAGVAHTGGVAGRLSVRRKVSPLLFGHAPRYHNGGIAGLKPDEVPAILQTGERVLSRRQTAAYEAAKAGAAGAGAAARVTTPIVAIGDAAVANALAGAAGESVVMTHVRNNWEGLSRGS